MLSPLHLPRLLLGLLLLRHFARASLYAITQQGAGALCNASVASVNATGYDTFNPQWQTAQHPNGSFTSSASSSLPDAEWLVTVSQNSNGTSETYYWLNTGEQEYWNDTSTQFDACAFIIGPGIPMNTLDLSQDDPGDCSVMITEPCRQALLSQVASVAALYTDYASPPPYSNLSAGDIPYICQDIAKSLGTADTYGWGMQSDYSDGWVLPNDCVPNFYTSGEPSTPAIQVLALTGLNASSPETSLNTGCPITGADGKKYYNLFGSDHGTYDLQTRVATPILTTFFSLANVEARNSVSTNASSQLRCPRITHFNEGSRVSPQLPQGLQPSAYPTYSFEHPVLTDGGIAGVSVGVLAFVVIVAVLVFFWWRRRRRRRRQRLADAETKEDMELTSSPASSKNNANLTAAAVAAPPATTSSSATITQELSNTGEKYETDGYQKQEIDGNPIVEVSGIGTEQQPAELDAGYGRWSINSSRISLSSYDTATSERLGHYDVP